ncbi:MAG: leucyl/phenylalanyl-tRNA--protein transferase, partial [Rheinheimera sp.]|nr:leucyl/phenylalanyl-tRNA--protein transferase [Rheinheimera sp.]
SMFNRLPDTAKLALVALQQHLQQVAPGWIDCQLPNPFLLQLGARRLPRADYVHLLTQLRQHSTSDCHWRKADILLEGNNG